jgi:hypothetical protein
VRFYQQIQQHRANNMSPTSQVASILALIKFVASPSVWADYTTALDNLLAPGHSVLTDSSFSELDTSVILNTTFYVLHYLLKQELAEDLHRMHPQSMDSVYPWDKAPHEIIHLGMRFMNERVNMIHVAKDVTAAREETRRICQQAQSQEDSLADLLGSLQIDSTNPSAGDSMHGLSNDMEDFHMG